MSFPLIPLPFASVVSPHHGSGTGSSDQPTSHQQQRRQHARQQQQAVSRNPNSLHTLMQDEAAITTRKAAIATYGYSWLQPAGVAKTMLGRKEEEIEREELERQMREQEEMEMEMQRGEELAREAALQEQQRAEEAGVEGERDLDDDIPDADADVENQEDQDLDADLDDDIPDADQTLDDSAFNVEGETGITDDVEDTNLGSEEDPSPAPARNRLAPPTNRAPPRPGLTRGNPSQLHPDPEQEALANLMLAEDEQNLADRDLDALIPDDDDLSEDMDGADLDDDVPEADEEEWQHTDTELELDESAGMLLDEEDEEEDDQRNNQTGNQSLDMSGLSEPDSRRVSRSGNAFTGTGPTSRPAISTPAGPSNAPVTPNIASSPTSPGRNWLPRSLFGITRPTRGSGSGNGSGSGVVETPPSQQPPGNEQETSNRSRRRRSGRNA